MFYLFWFIPNIVLISPRLITSVFLKQIRHQPRAAKTQVRKSDGDLYKLVSPFVCKHKGCQASAAWDYVREVLYLMSRSVW